MYNEFSGATIVMWETFKYPVRKLGCFRQSCGGGGTHHYIRVSDKFTGLIDHCQHFYVMHASVRVYDLDRDIFILILFIASFEGKISSIVWLMGSQINHDNII